jgi:glycosyltransferase involved in cell wall biosynthesis
LKVLLVHNLYQQAGGEDVVFAAESRLLTSRGHTVLHYTAHNDAVRDMTALGVGLRTIWSQRAYREVRELIRTERPDIAHVHNTLPLISPAVYYAAAVGAVPVVHTVHNYRIACPNGLCFRDGRACTDCVGRVVPWPGVLHACYRNSRGATGAIAAMLSTHRMLGTWRSRVHAYIAPTEFARSVLISAGLPPKNVVVKPHFVDPDPGEGGRREGFALFVGRLSSEKGVTTLLDAWSRIGGEVPLRIVGNGPLGPAVAEAVATMPSVSWLGALDGAEILALLQRAAFLIFPSAAFETFGRVIIEAFATGTPVIATGHGAAAELVRDGHNGFHFQHRAPEDLAAKVRLLAGNPERCLQMGRAARADFEARYTADSNYCALMKIYHDVSGGIDSNLVTTA